MTDIGWHRRHVAGLADHAGTLGTALASGLTFKAVAAPAATLLSISSFGVAGVVGLAAIIAALAAVATARETGGSVIGGMPYVVGERRPELFIPETSGRIVPQVDAAGMGGGGASGGRPAVNNYFHADVGALMKQRFENGDLDAPIIAVFQRNRTRFGMKG